MAWTQSLCRPDVWWMPASASRKDFWYWTSGYGTIRVSGTVYDWYSWANWECGALGAPITPYGPITNPTAGEGVRFQGGIIMYKYATGGWATYYMLPTLAGGVEFYTESEGGPEGDWPDPRTEPKPKRGRKPKPPNVANEAWIAGRLASDERL